MRKYIKSIIPFLLLNSYFYLNRLKYFINNHSNERYKYIRILPKNIVYVQNDNLSVHNLIYKLPRRRGVFNQNVVYDVEHIPNEIIVNDSYRNQDTNNSIVHDNQFSTNNPIFDNFMGILDDSEERDIITDQ